MLASYILSGQEIYIKMKTSELQTLTLVILVHLKLGKSKTINYILATLLAIIIPITEFGCMTSEYHAAPQLFQCYFSLEQGLHGKLFTPNIPDSYFSPENAAALSTNASTGDNLTPLTPSAGQVYIFPIPPPESAQYQCNCSGNVVAIQYCYMYKAQKLRDTEKTDVFHFLSLIMTKRLNFKVEHKFTVQTTPQESVCTDANPAKRVCCDSANITIQLSSPLTNYTFGVATVSDNIWPLEMPSSDKKYSVKRFLTRPSHDSDLETDHTFTPFEREQRCRSLLFLRFIIGTVSASYIIIVVARV